MKILHQTKNKECNRFNINNEKKLWLNNKIKYNSRQPGPTAIFSILYKKLEEHDLSLHALTLKVKKRGIIDSFPGLNI